MSFVKNHSAINQTIRKTRGFPQISNGFDFEKGLS